MQLFSHVFSLALIGIITAADSGWQWWWVCKQGKCVRSEKPTTNSDDVIGTSQNICKLMCGKYGSLWPRPTGQSILGQQVFAFHPSRFSLDINEVNGRPAKDYIQRVGKIFQANLYRDCGQDCTVVPDTDLVVYMSVVTPSLRLDWTTDESYILDITTKGVQVQVKIRAGTVYGARHGLETLGQLITDYAAGGTRGFRHVLVVVGQARITDKPVYPHRGLIIDTARNYLPLSGLMRTIDGMAMNKLNVLHWHVTDSQSFPLETPRVPKLVRYGAYSADKIYSVQDTIQLMEYARLRGIRVIIEIDAPAHSGNGWQWGESEGLGPLAVCVNKQPWRKMCIQPPCGQLNPANPNMYDVLKNLYNDIIDLSPPGEVFHMGGDEVYRGTLATIFCGKLGLNCMGISLLHLSLEPISTAQVFFGCWNSSKEVLSYMQQTGRGVSNDDYISLWGEFHKKALDKFDEVNPSPNTSVILWSSHLTQPNVIETYLDKKRYVIETWVETSNDLPKQLLQKGYRLIMATKDKWYLDHGFWGSTVYHQWRPAYENRLPRNSLVLGGETAMWAELVDDMSLDVKVWPRSAAVAERLWADPDSSSAAAEPRLQQMRIRLVRRGLRPDAISPMYCTQNEAECF